MFSKRIVSIESFLVDLVKDDVDCHMTVEESLWSIFEKGMFESLIYDQIKEVVATSGKPEETVAKIRELLNYEKIKIYDWKYERKTLIRNVEILINSKQTVL